MSYKTPTHVLETLFDHASKIRPNAYVPYSHFKVAATLITDKGDIFGGVNAENAAYKGHCAETAAIAAMVTAGQHKIRDIVVVGPDENLCTPCGHCRQVIREFAESLDDKRVHVFSHGGKLLKSYSVHEMLPDSFGPENLATGPS